MSAAVLYERVKAISSRLQGHSVQRGDKVIVFFHDKTWLISTLWALLKKGVVAIPLAATEHKEDLGAIRNHAGASHIITEKKYASLTGSFETIIICDDDMTVLPAADEQGIAGESTRFIFYNRNRSQSPHIVSDASLQEYFAQLDEALLPAGDGGMMLSDKISFSQKVMELLWASSRGVPVVIHSLTNDHSFLQYEQFNNWFPMEFGLFHFGSYVESSEKNKYQQLFDTVGFADKNDFTAVWTPERHFNEFGGLFPNPSVLSAALAVSTSNVQIRSGSIVAPLHHPVRIAEDWSLIDNLSNGRVAISFASGWQCDDFIFFPENYPQRHTCMMEHIESVRRLWRGEKLPFKNGLGKEIEVPIFPKPIQQELPIWITVSARTETFIDAGKIGANILTHLLWQDTDELIDKIAAYRKSLEENGFDPRSRKVAVMVHTYLGSDSEAVKQKVREPLKNYIRTSTQLIQAMVKSNAQVSDAKDIAGRYGGLNDEVPAHLMDEVVEIAFNRFFEQAALLGTVEKAGILLKKLKMYDVDEIAALIDFGLGRDDILEGLVYLNELRKLHDKKSNTGFPISITHCSAPELAELAANTDTTGFLDTQRVILLEADDDSNIPEYLTRKTRIVQHTTDATGAMAFSITSQSPATPDMEFAFTSSVSNEFE